MTCGQCKCYTAFNVLATMGRCRRYRTVRHLLSECITGSYHCDCKVVECLEKR